MALARHKMEQYLDGHQGVASRAAWKRPKKKNKCRASPEE